MNFEWKGNWNKEFIWLFFHRLSENNNTAHQLCPKVSTSCVSHTNTNTPPKQAWKRTGSAVRDTTHTRARAHKHTQTHTHTHTHTDIHTQKYSKILANPANVSENGKENLTNFLPYTFLYILIHSFQNNFRFFSMLNKLASPLLSSSHTYDRFEASYKTCFPQRAV